MINIDDNQVWEHTLITRLMPYMPFVAKFWDTIAEADFVETGVFPIEGPPGLFVRFTRTPIRSPLRGIQAFPFVATSYLQLSGVAGGVVKMIDRVCAGNKVTIDGYTLMCRGYLKSTIQQGQFIAIVPNDIAVIPDAMGRWVYMTRKEMSDVSLGIVGISLKDKLIAKL